MNQIDELQWQLHCALHDIQAYRGALGYSVPGDHNGKLMDGTTPQCGMCNSEYRKNLEAKCAEMREAMQFCNCGYLGGEHHPVCESQRGIKLEHALSGDCGKGWKSPQQIAEMLEQTIWVLRHTSYGSKEAREYAEAEAVRLEKLIH